MHRRTPGHDANELSSWLSIFSIPLSTTVTSGFPMEQNANAALEDESEPEANDHRFLVSA
jgi:hypothetical protein